MFKKVNPKMDLPKLEEEILKFWDENKIFEKSLELRKNGKKFSFYDGPPFATGTPHYGHIVPSIMKDIIPRYKTMKGYYVERKWGWDCHGLPIENIAEKELGIKSKKDIETFGVDKFNEFCRSKVLGYVDDWKKVIRRLGRWVDMENAYKTMDRDFMESVWWVFKQLWDKGLIYESYRSMHICPRCETTLSQSEVAEGYKDVKDLSVIAKFELVDEPGTYLLAWTTTPWTLIGNVALAVGDGIDYVKVQVDQGIFKGQKFILAKRYFETMFSKAVFSNMDPQNKEIVVGGTTLLEQMKGKVLQGAKYQQLFDYDEIQKVNNFNNGFKVVSTNFVAEIEGTGIVHIAPAFGEDDLNLGKELDLPFVQHVGMDGKIKDGYGEFSGLSVKPSGDVKATDKKIIEYLENNNLLHQEEYTHSYPHCWRCETPLLNYATSSWFVAVEKIKDEALKLAKEINWSPKHLKNGRFGEWLNGARDWSISRQRYWASVIPIWACDKNPNHKDVFGSASDLEDKSQQKISDLHKHIVDKISYKCDQCGGVMKRIPDVLDTWFDSGSMPYAQKHYPFKNKEIFDDQFPADFIAEGVDQTRAWFYYLHILGVAIKDKPAYKNVMTNGIVLASDGKKMSKRLQNYSDPMDMLNKYGADVMRIYFSSSPVMQAENTNFSETDMAEFSRGIFRMLWNSYLFFVLYGESKNLSSAEINNQDFNNILDLWILSKVEKLNLEVEKSLENYNLPVATRQFSIFIDELSNWYIRRSRKRFWKSENENDKKQAHIVLYYVLVKLSKLLAPFAPFLSDSIYKNLTAEESVHLADFPSSKNDLINDDIENKMDGVRKIVEIGLAKRAEAKIKVRQPLSLLAYSGEKLSGDFEQIIADEVNVKEVQNQDSKDFVLLDINLTPALIAEGQIRDFVRGVQELRKELGLNISDRIDLLYQTDDKDLSKSIEKFIDYIKKETLSDSILVDKKINIDFQKQIFVSGKQINVQVKSR